MIPCSYGTTLFFIQSFIMSTGSVRTSLCVVDKCCMLASSAEDKGSKPTRSSEGGRKLWHTPHHTTSQRSLMLNCVCLAFIIGCEYLYKPHCKHAFRGLEDYNSTLVQHTPPPSSSTTCSPSRGFGLLDYRSPLVESVNRAHVLNNELCVLKDTQTTSISTNEVIQVAYSNILCVEHS